MIPVSAADAAAGVNPNSVNTLSGLVQLHFSFMVTDFLVMCKEVFLKILLIVLF